MSPAKRDPKWWNTDKKGRPKPVKAAKKTGKPARKRPGKPYKAASKGAAATVAEAGGDAPRTKAVATTAASKPSAKTSSKPPAARTGPKPTAKTGPKPAAKAGAKPAAKGTTPQGIKGSRGAVRAEKTREHSEAQPRPPAPARAKRSLERKIAKADTKSKERERLGLPHPAAVAGKSKKKYAGPPADERTRLPATRSPFTGVKFDHDDDQVPDREPREERATRRREESDDRGDRRDRLSQQERLAYGRHPVAEALARGDVERLWIEEGITPNADLRRLLKTAEEQKVPVQYVKEAYLSSRIGHNPHQGILAQVKPFTFAVLKDVLEAAQARRDAGDLASATILILDGLEDPGNFGGILRTAAGLGIAGVIIPGRRSVGVTAAVHKTSAGTVGRIPLGRVANLRYALDELKAAGWWSVAATAKGGMHPRDLPSDVPLVVVMGSEHEGLTPIVESTCDFKVQIPLANGVESLNVGAATAVLLGQITMRK